ncbi:hypothetical protein [Microcoleus sp. S13_B4]|uniref:hypothetical protein n=1 Tax=Microcoleus sp. S13_B4 TaxID=3055408 RepID=UPI002FD5F72E
MTIDFGSIKGYNPDRGFGFVGHTFFNPDGKVFFHIKKIRRKHPELAQKLDSGEAFETVNFWYEIETTEKGEQVSKLWLNADDIPKSYTNELCGLKQKIESIWKNIGSPKPSWLDIVTRELVGVARRHELSVERDNLKSQLRAAKDERRREAEALLPNEIARLIANNRLKKTKADESEQQKNESEPPKHDPPPPPKHDPPPPPKHDPPPPPKPDPPPNDPNDELKQLLAEMRPLKFKNSKELSAYIVKHKLGYRYPNISGIVIMEDGGKEWPFSGGFPPKIYKIICEKLGLVNQGTSARATKFTSYQQLLNRK